MAAHPAGKGIGLADLIGPAVANTLDQLVAMAPVAMPAFDEAVYEIMADLAALLISKQADYGPRAISDSPGGPLNGINVRMHDKLSRAVNLADLATPFHEAIVDTYRDLANYAVIAVMVLEGTWPK